MNIRYVLPIAVLVAAWLVPANAEDQNGYTAQYECRAENPNCDVDIAALGNRQCDQTITPATPWSEIDWFLNTICIAAGDHTPKGRLTIPGDRSGTPGNYKVLRYTRDGDNGDDPWNQSPDQQTKLHRLILQGADYWLIHRLTFPVDYTWHIARLLMDEEEDANSTQNVIVDRVLVEGPGLPCYTSSAKRNRSFYPRQSAGFHGGKHATNLATLCFTASCFIARAIH